MDTPLVCMHLQLILLQTYPIVNLFFLLNVFMQILPFFNLKLFLADLKACGCFLFHHLRNILTIFHCIAPVHNIFYKWFNTVYPPYGFFISTESIAITIFYLFFQFRKFHFFQKFTFPLPIGMINPRLDTASCKKSCSTFFWPS